MAMNRDPFRKQPQHNPLPDSAEAENLSRGQTRKAFLGELTGLLILVGGFLGYWVYLELQNAPILLTNSPKASPPKPKSSSPSPTITPSFASPTIPGALPSPTGSPSVPSAVTPIDPAAPALTPDEEIYQRSPRTGIYYAKNPVLSASRREVVGGGERFCIRIINGPIQKTAGEQQVVISSLSFRPNGIYVDATQEELKLDRSYTELTDSLSTWQLLERKQDRSGVMAACLASKEPFVRQVPSTGQ